MVIGEGVWLGGGGSKQISHNFKKTSKLQICIFFSKNIYIKGCGQGRKQLSKARGSQLARQILNIMEPRYVADSITV